MQKAACGMENRRKVRGWLDNERKCKRKNKIITGREREM